MNPTGWQSRLLVPRWRSLSNTLRSGELRTEKRETNQIQRELPLASLEKWLLEPNLVTAAELVEAALVEGQEKRAVDAALQLLSKESAATPLIKLQAASLLYRAGRADEIPAPYLFPGRSGDAAYWRAECRINPHDALAWVELALRQTIRGHPRSAEKSMNVALALAPHNRHVLRSASRLLLHLNEKTQAHDLLVRNSATSRDPWLVAAEISLAEVAERDPKFYRQGLRLLQDSGLFPSQLTELAGASATRELLEGNRKKSKRMFEQSMVAPTGSSLAQAEWATPRLGAEVVPISRYGSTSEPHEAESFHLYRGARFSEVPAACEKWADVDPFSIRPFEFGSAAAGHAGELEKAQELAYRGLLIRPNSPVLINCLAYALASLDKPVEASLVLDKLKLKDQNISILNLSMANRGLIKFRSGDVHGGILEYLRAIEGFNKLGHRVSSAHAKVYLAREAVRAKIQDAENYVRSAQEAMRPFANTEAADALRRVEAAVNLKQSDPPTYISPPDVGTASKPTPLPKPSIKWTTPGWPIKR